MKEKHEFKVGDTAYIYHVSEPLESVLDMKCIVIQDWSCDRFNMYRVCTQNNREFVSMAEELSDNPVSVVKRIRSRVEREIRERKDFLKTLDDVEKKYMEEASEYYQPGLFEKEE